MHALELDLEEGPGSPQEVSIDTAAPQVFSGCSYQQAKLSFFEVPFCWDWTGLGDWEKKNNLKEAIETLKH